MTTPSAQERRARFYDDENREFDRNRKTFRPEEPNLRVYARSVLAILETAQAGLSAEDFSSLCRALSAEMKQKAGW
jgi:hypothetical protein